MNELILWFTQLGVLLVFVATLAARIGMPVPASPVLMIAGSLAVYGRISALACFAASIAGNLAADAVWFWSGRRWGHRVLRFLCRISLSPDSCVRQSESLILRWGGLALVAGKFVPGVSVVAAPMAGALKMSWWRFIAFDLVSGTVWTAVFMGLGALFAAQIERLLDLMAGGGALAMAALAIAIVIVLGWRYAKRRKFLREVDTARISVEELRALMAAGAAPVVIDVRSGASAQIDPRRIPGALAVELEAIAALAPQLPRDREIVIYCNCPNEAAASLAARTLARLGLHRSRPLAGGLDAWFAGGAAKVVPDIVPSGLPGGDVSPLSSAVAAGRRGRASGGRA